MRPMISGLALLWLACARASSSYVATPEDRFPRPEDIAILPDSGPVIRGHIMPLYPPTRRESDLPSVQVIAAYVVDTTGRVEVPTVSFLESPPLDVQVGIPHGFRRSVCDYLRDVRFRPATVDGRRQRALVIQPFVFVKESPPPVPNLAPHEKTLREMPRSEVFEWLSGLPACHPLRADGYYW